METPIEMDDLGVAPFWQETPIYTILTNVSKIIKLS